MLITKAILERIKTGEVGLAFRCWQRPTVKSGGTLKTAIGLLNIENVEEIPLKNISADDAKQAGYQSRQLLVDDLSKRKGQIYRIKMSYLGADPRIELRENAQLDESELCELKQRLERMDARSSIGPWTQRALTAIEKHPKTLAAELASQIGMEKKRFKENVRKLKNLGLTISHETGYTLSPRGMVVLEYFRNSA